MSDPLSTIVDMFDSEVVPASDGDVSVLAEIVAGIEGVDVALRAAEVAQTRLFARAGRLAATQAARSRESVRVQEMALRSIAAELGGVLRVTDRTVQRRIDEALTIVEDYPRALTAWEEGRITRGHVRVIVDVGACVPAARRAEFEDAAIARSEKDTPNRVRPGSRSSPNGSRNVPSRTVTRTPRPVGPSVWCRGGMGCAMSSRRSRQ